MEIASNVTEMRSFLGLASYYRRFIEDFGKTSAPLTRMLENNRPFIWDDEGKRAFYELKSRLASAPILIYPDFTNPFLLDTDGSDKGIGAVLSQLSTDGIEHPLAYYSRTLNKHERNYSITRKVLLAAIDAIEHFRCYLYEQQFTLRTDHVAIRWLQNFKEPSGQLARWLERLSAFDFVVEQRPGRKHGNADPLSRKINTSPMSSSDRANETFDMKTEQAKDPFITQVLQWISTGVRPPLEKQLILNTKKRCYGRDFDELIVVEGLLSIIEKSSDNLTSRIVPPKHLRQELLRSYHEGIGGGHLGLEKTYAKLKERFYWPRMKEDARLACYNCARCGARKCTNHASHGVLVTIAAGFPFERIAMDIVGPLLKTLRNNRYLLVIIDYYTRWPEAYALEHQDAHSVAIKLISEVIARYGAPYIIHTDQGTNFESNLVSELCKLYDIKKTKTTPYHPQSDGLVERLNRTLIDTIALIARDAKETWDLRIGPALMAIRSSVQSTTGFSPHFLLFGREMRLPADLYYDVPQEAFKSPIEAVASLKQALSQVHESVVKAMETSQRRQKDCYDRRTYGNRFKPGDFVWMVNKNPELLSNKFHDRWLGPYEVIKRCSDLVYEILNRDSGKLKRVHFNLLKAAKVNADQSIMKLQQEDVTAPDTEDSDDDIYFQENPPGILFRDRQPQTSLPAACNKPLTDAPTPEEKAVNENTADKSADNAIPANTGVTKTPAPGGGIQAPTEQFIPPA